MQVQIKFKKTGSNSVYGSFSAGDILRCDRDLAEHYVREGLATYTEPPQVAPTQAPAVPSRKVRPSKAK